MKHVGDLAHEKSWVVAVGTLAVVAGPLVDSHFELAVLVGQDIQPRSRQLR